MGIGRSLGKAEEGGCGGGGGGGSEAVDGKWAGGADGSEIVVGKWQAQTSENMVQNCVSACSPTASTGPSGLYADRRFSLGGEGSSSLLRGARPYVAEIFNHS